MRPRRRGERRSLRTFAGVSLRPPLAFNPRHRRLSTPTDAFQLHPDIASYDGTIISGLARDGLRGDPEWALACLLLRELDAGDRSPFAALLENVRRFPPPAIKRVFDAREDEDARKALDGTYALEARPISFHLPFNTPDWSPYDRVHHAVHADP